MLDALQLNLSNYRIQFRFAVVTYLSGSNERTHSCRFASGGPVFLSSVKVKVLQLATYVNMIIVLLDCCQVKVFIR